MRDIKEVFDGFAKSRFRSRFRLGLKEQRYLQDKGITVIVEHARQFVQNRLAQLKPPNDGKQTPFKGHPVFVAQHATATCCRGCLEKWHHIPKGKALNTEQIEYIIAIIKRWIEMQMPEMRIVE